MSLTITALVVGSMCLIVGLILTVGLDDLGSAAAISGTILIAIAVGSFIVATGSYNSNDRDSKEREKIICVEQGYEVIRYNSSDFCVKPGSQIIRTL